MIATAACKIFFHSFAILGKTISVSSKLGEKYFFPSQLMVLGLFFFEMVISKSLYTVYNKPSSFLTLTKCKYDKR